MKATVDVLREARELISDPDRWCQTTVALMDDGRVPTDFASLRDARRWCAVGAVWAIDPEAQGAEEYLSMAANDAGIISFNDDPVRSHPEVLAAFDRAIELAGEES